MQHASNVQRLEKGSFAVPSMRLGSEFLPSRKHSIFIFMRVGTALIRRHLFIRRLPKAGT